jgi:hypothetical protein
VFLYIFTSYWWQASHLLLIRTGLGYGTILMAACAHQDCSATDYFIITGGKDVFCVLLEKD